MQKQPSEGFLTKGVTRNFAEFTRKYLYRNLFFDKVKLIKNESLAQVFSCEICEIYRNTVFAERHLVAASDYSSINSMKGELVNKTVNYDTKTEAYVPILAGSVSY